MKHKRLRHMGEEVNGKKQLRVGCACERATSAHVRNNSQRSVTSEVKGGSRRCGVAERHRPFFLRSGGTRLTSTRCPPTEPSALLSVVYRTDLTNGTNSAPKHPLLPHETGKIQGQIQHFQLIHQQDQPEIIQIFKNTRGDKV